MKGWPAIGLLLCLIVPFFGAWQFLSIRILRIKEEVTLRIHQGLDEKQQVFFAFTEKQAYGLKWEHSREFEYQGQMYDVIRTEMHGDTTHYWCYWDRKETKLKNELRLVVAKALGGLPENQSRQHKITEFLKNLYPHSPTTPLCFLDVDATIHINPGYFYSTSTFISIPPFPPPEFC